MFNKLFKNKDSLKIYNSEAPKATYLSTTEVKIVRTKEREKFKSTI